MGSKRRIFAAIERVSAFQGHPRSMILVPVEGACTTFYCDFVTLVLSCKEKEKSPFEGAGHWDRLSLCSDVTSCMMLYRSVSMTRLRG